jgi:hypothetical protein
MGKSLLKKVYTAPEVTEPSRHGEKEFLTRTPPEFKYEPVRFWNRFIKFRQIEKVR